MSEEKVYTSMYSRNAELYHHGVKGQKWGVENGPPYPLSDEISTGKSLRQKQIEKLKKQSEFDRNIIKRNENFYKEKENRNIKMKENDKNKKIEKAEKKFERQEKSIKKHINSQKNDDISTKLAKEDALKAEIKMKKLLAKENGGKYRYKDMTDEEKEYYRKELSNTISNVAWLTLVTATAAAGVYEFHEAKRGDDYSDYGINRRPSKETRKEIAKGQLSRAKEVNRADERLEQAKKNRNEANKKAMEIADKHWKPEEKSIRLAAQKEADEADKEFKNALANQAKVRGYDMLVWGSQPGHAKYTKSEKVSDEKKKIRRRTEKNQMIYNTPWYLEDD